MKTQHYYEEIQNLYGLSQMKETMQKWHRILSGLQAKNEQVALLLPNLFLLSKQGAGKSNFVYLLSEYLYSTGFMTFYGDVKVFEFYLEYCSPAEDMGEINRFARQLKNAAGFRSEYKGVVAIDISAWENHVKENHFVLFLEYLALIDANVCIVFMANHFSEEAEKQAETILNSFCRIRSLRFDYPSKEDFATFCRKKMQSFGLYPDESAEALLCGSIEKLMQSQYFYGYKTVNRLCLDIVFELASGTLPQGGKVSAIDLQGFSGQSTFIQNLCAVKELSRIGFGGAIE